MDRFDRYSIYLMSWGRGSAPASPVCPPDPAFADAALASGIGVYQHAHGAPLLSIDGFDRCVAVLCEEEREDAPDVGPSAHDDIRLTDRDEREKAESRARLQGLILAGGQTDTGGRWLFDAAADEIVRLRADGERAWSAARERAARLDEIRGYLRARTSEATQDAADRVAAELRQATEALEQARAKADELRGTAERLSHQHQRDEERLRDLARRHGDACREQGASEMRERAADAVRRRAARTRGLDGTLDDLEREIRSLSLDGAPSHHPLDMDAADRRRGATVKALEAIGVEFGRAVQAARIAEEEGGSTPDAAHGACLRLANGDGAVGFFDEGDYAADALRYRIRNMLGTAAPGLTEDERATLERLGYVEKAGTWQHLWVGPAYDPAKPDDLAELRRDMAGHRELDKTELSAEDAATLRGAGWVSSVVWTKPEEDGGWAESDPIDLGFLREAAAELRAKAPAVAHETPGKATGEEVTTAGTSSLSEEQGAAQGPGPHWAWRVTPRGQLTCIQCGAAREGTIGFAIAHIASCPLAAMLHEQDVEGAQGTSPAPGQDGAPHVVDRGQALPKPKGVVLGQRWRFAHHRLDLRVTDSAGVFLTDGVGSGFTTTADEMLTSPHWTFLGGPSPQDPSPKRDGEPVLVPGPVEVHGDPTPRGAYVVGPVSRGDADTSEPTARDAVAGMLARGRWEIGEALARGDVSVEEALRRVRAGCVQLVTPSAHDRACIAALEALARGGLLPFANVSPYITAHAIAEQERDEARAEAAALREEVERWTGRAADLEKQRDEACKDALDAMRAARTLREQVAGEPAAEPSGMRIEKRADGEYLVGAPNGGTDADGNGCGADSPGGALGCTYHFGGEHLATYPSNGAEFVEERWPIASSAHLVEPASGGTSHPEALTSADGRVTLIIRDGVEARDVLAIVAELLDVPLSTATLEQQEAMGIIQRAAMSVRGALHDGIREGERRAKVKAAELVRAWAAVGGAARGKAKALDRKDKRIVGWRREEWVINEHIADVRAAFDLPTDGQPPTGEPVVEEEAPKAGTVTHGGVAVTAPETMTLGEVWAALKSSPAFRVCLDIELRAARESARGTTPADIETARRDIRVAVLDDAFRAGGERARADGIVEGLSRAAAIVESSLDLDINDRWHHVAYGIKSALAAAMGVPCPDAAPPVAPDRETLGREVRAAWVTWAHEQPYPKGSWLLPWGSLSEPDREVDRRIGERLFNMGVRHAQSSASTTAAPAQGPTFEALRELAVSFRRNEAMAAARVDKHPDGTRAEPFHDGRRIAFAYCVKALCRVAGIEPPPCPPSQPADPTPASRARAAPEGRVTWRGFGRRWYGTATGGVTGDGYAIVDPDDRAAWGSRLVLLSHVRRADPQGATEQVVGPTREELLKLVSALDEAAAKLEASAKSHTPMSEFRWADGGQARGFAVAANEIRGLLGLPMRQSPTLAGDMGPQGTPGPVTQDGSAGDHAERVASAGRLLRVAGWTNTAMRLESGALTPQGALDVLRDGSMEEPDADDMAAIAALEALAHAEPEQPVKPPHNADHGALAEALEREGRAHAAYSDRAAQRDGTILLRASRLVRTEADARLILSALGFAPGAADRVLSGETPPPVCSACRGEYSATYCEPCRNTGVVQGVDLGTGPAETAAHVLERRRLATHVPASVPHADPTTALRPVYLCRGCPDTGDSASPGPCPTCSKPRDLVGHAVPFDPTQTGVALPWASTSGALVPLATFTGPKAMALAEARATANPGAWSSIVALGNAADVHGPPPAAPSPPPRPGAPDAEPEQPVKPSHNAEQGALAEALDRAKAVLHEAATHTATNTAEIEAERFAREIDAKQAIDGPALVAPVVVAEGERGRRSATLANAFALPDEGAADRWSAAALNRPDAPSPLPSTASKAPAAVTPPQGPRIELRYGVEFFAGPWPSERCSARSPGRGLCIVHFEGQHLALGPVYDGASRIYERWPIEPAPPETCSTCGGSGEVSAMDYTGNMEPCDACEPASPETPDPRWEPGATWEHHGERRTLLESQRQHDPPRAYFRELGWLDGMRRAEMTEVNGWRYVGKE